MFEGLKLPAEHPKRVRTTNLLERLFDENRRRVKVIPHFFVEKAGMKLVYATMLAASAKWRGVKMTPLISRQVDELWQTGIQSSTCRNLGSVAQANREPRHGFDRNIVT